MVGQQAESSKELLKTAGLDRELPEQGQLKVVEDPFAEIARKSWRPVLITIALASALSYGYSVYQSTQLKAKQSSGDSFIGLQRTFAELQQLNPAAVNTTAGDPTAGDRTAGDSAKPDAAKESEKAEAQKRFESQIKSLSFAKPPYPELASFYLSLNQVSRQAGTAEDKAAREKILSDKRYASFPAGNIERLTGELLFLAAARAQIDSDLSAARSNLEKLSNDGVYAAGAAAKTLVKIADTAEAQEKAKANLEAVVARHPDLAGDLIQE